MWTEKYIHSLKSKASRYRLTEEGPGRGKGRLVLDILEGGTKTFYFQYFYEAKRKLVKIGDYKQQYNGSGYTLAAARDRCRQLSDILQQGFDVKTYLEEIVSKEKERVRTLEREQRQGTFEQLLESYTDRMEEQGKRSHIEVRRSLNRHVITPFPELTRECANKIQPQDIMIILRKMIDEGITTHSNRVRSFLHAAFQHGLKEDLNPRRYKTEGVIFGLTANPVSAIPRQQDYEKVGQHVISEHEIPIIWNELPKQSKTVGYAVRLAITTGIRTGELVRLRISDIDLDDRLMTIPPDVSKNGVTHVVPLNDLAIVTLTELFKISEGCEFVFPGVISGKVQSNIHIHATSVGTAVNEFCSDNDKVRKFTPQHDIRRTVKTLMGKAGISKEVRDRIQNHALNDVSTIHYDRYDYLEEKKAGLNIWNDYLLAVLGKDKKVTPIRKAS